MVRDARKDDPPANERETVVHSKQGLPPKKGWIFTCSECGGDEFWIFRIEGQDHEHRQCVKCEVSYCPLGEDCPP